MDDTQKSQPTQNPIYTSDGAVQTGVGVQNTPAIGSVHREIERPVTDFVKPTESAPVIEQELKEIGVNEVSSKPNLDDTHRQIGVTHSAEFAEPNPNNASNVTFPLTDDDIKKIEKDDDANSSAFWLSTLIKKVKRVLSLN